MTESRFSRIGGISYAFSSIVGAGVYLVPCQIHESVQGLEVAVLLAGFCASLIVSVMVAGLCFDGDHDGRNLQEIVAASLPFVPNNLAPIILSSALLLGLPVAAIYAAQIVQSAFGMSGGSGYVTAPLILLGSLIPVLLGARTATVLQGGAAAAVVAACFSVVSDMWLSFDHNRGSPISEPHFGAALLMSMLAFAGVENMPGVSRRFRGRQSLLFAMISGVTLALLVYALMLVVIRQHGPRSINPMVALAPVAQQGVCADIAGSVAALVAAVIVSNLITWNIGMTETWMQVLGRTGMRERLKLQGASAGVYLAVLSAILNGCLDVGAALAQAGAAFAAVYALLAVAALAARRGIVNRAAALVLLVFIGITLVLAPVYAILPLAIVVALYVRNSCAR